MRLRFTINVLLNESTMELDFDVIYLEKAKFCIQFFMNTKKNKVSHFIQVYVGFLKTPKKKCVKNDDHNWLVKP